MRVYIVVITYPMGNLPDFARAFMSDGERNEWTEKWGMTLLQMEGIAFDYEEYGSAWCQIDDHGGIASFEFYTDGMEFKEHTDLLRAAEMVHFSLSVTDLEHLKHPVTTSLGKAIKAAGRVQE